MLKNDSQSNYQLCIMNIYNILMLCVKYFVLCVCIFYIVI